MGQVDSSDRPFIREERPMKILIADDESVSRRLLQNYLQKWGYEVTAARDGAEAWRLFEDGTSPWSSPTG